MRYVLPIVITLLSSPVLSEEQNNIYIHGDSIHLTTDSGCVSINGVCISPQQFNTFKQQLNSVEKESHRSSAIGLAASSLQFDTTPGKFSMSAGFGSWKGEKATAFGAGYTSNNGMLRYNVRGTHSGNTLGVGGGISLTLN